MSSHSHEEMAEHADEMEMAGILRDLGSDLSADGTYGDELAERLGLQVRVFLCHAVSPPAPLRAAWYRYALDPRVPGDPPDVVARSHAAAAAVLLCERMQRAGREAPESLRALASRSLMEGTARWVGGQVDLGDEELEANAPRARAPRGTRA